MAKRSLIERYIPISRWGRHYTRANLMDDSVAALIVAIMLIPQSLGLSLVAGLPPETGLYASIFGLAVYSVFGTSNTLSVAPVAVISLMTAAALAKLPLEDPAEILNAALLLALLSGIGLFFLGLFRLGFMANFLSHPVISAFVTASALIIGMSQMKHLFGIEGDGHNLIGLAMSLLESIDQTNLITLGMGIVSIGFILWCKAKMEWVLVKVGLPSYFARVVSRTGPVFIVIATSLAAYLWRLDLHGLQLLGEIPSGIPEFRVPQVDVELLGSLAGSAALIAIIGFVESISVAQTLAAKRRER
ncbi:MAG TPA: sodium-independent anion transporter, partial [Gammaproteobacteria bacterium]|nr:sodium-independent anion transporter [Gammaproteobacteria bacterium]